MGLKRQLQTVKDLQSLNRKHRVTSARLIHKILINKDSKSNNYSLKFHKI